MAKHKGKPQGEANFISPLPIEECALRLDNLNEENIQIVILKMSSDTVDFTARLFEHERLRAEAKGALRRWEGTLTRVDVRVTVREGIVAWLILVGIMLILTLLLIPTLVLVAAHVNPFTWLLTASSGIITILGVMVIAHRFTPYDDAPRNLLRLLETTLQ